jgi:propanol-preferring alcohol dehydrogenase
MILSRIAPVTDAGAPLDAAEIPAPEPGAGEVLLRITACGVCHTELDEIEGRTPPPFLPVVPGHQVVGTVERLGPGVRGIAPGTRVGVAWIFFACGTCAHCRAGNENLCPEFRATGRDAHGGYAEYMTAQVAFVHPIPSAFTDVQAAPLLCAGAVGYRSLRLCNLRNGEPLGLVGFGASAHLVLQMTRHDFPDTPIFVFAREETERAFARELGAAWAGPISAPPPAATAACIDTTPVWTPVLAALETLAPGGRLVINAIRKESQDRQVLADLDYPKHLWMEKEIKSVANVTRRDVREFLARAASIPLAPEVEEYPLAEAGRALRDLKRRKIRGAKVLRIATERKP